MERGRLEIRRTDNSRVYAPDRDMLNLAKPMLKGALALTLNSFEEDELKTEEFEELIAVIAKMERDALEKDKPENITAGVFQALEKVRPDVTGLFLANFFRCFSVAYIGAYRDATQEGILTEETLESSLESVSAISMLPDTMRKEARRLMQCSGMLHHTYAMSRGMYSRILEEEKEKEEAEEKETGNGDNDSCNG